MADFKTHLMGAAVVSGIAATATMMTGLASHTAIVEYFVLGVLGGLLPDIDSDTSVPVRVAFNVLAISGCFLLAFFFGQRYSLVELVILWVTSFLLVRYGVFALFTRMTVHRGLIHSIPAGVAAGLITVLLVNHVFSSSPVHAWICGTFVLLGFLIHLLLDECFSVNLMGMQVKSSFGTAFNLGSLDNPLGTIGLYATIIGLFSLCPPPDTFLHVLLDQETYRGLRAHLLPTQGWFDGLLVSLLEKLALAGEFAPLA
jgi:hypothetical protein